MKVIHNLIVISFVSAQKLRLWVCSWNTCTLRKLHSQVRVCVLNSNSWVRTCIKSVPYVCARIVGCCSLIINLLLIGFASWNWSILFFELNVKQRRKQLKMISLLIIMTRHDNDVYAYAGIFWGLNFSNFFLNKNFNDVNFWHYALVRLYYIAHHNITSCIDHYVVAS